MNKPTFDNFDIAVQRYGEYVSCGAFAILLVPILILVAPFAALGWIIKRFVPDF